MAFGAFSIFEDVDPSSRMDAHRIALATTAQQTRIARLHQKPHTLTLHTPWHRPETAFADSERPPPLKRRRLDAPPPPSGSSMPLQSSPLGHISNNVRVASFKTPAALIPIVPSSPPKKIVPEDADNATCRCCHLPRISTGISRGSCVPRRLWTTTARVWSWSMSLWNGMRRHVTLCLHFPMKAA